MTKQLEALIAEMKAAVEKATPGQWKLFSHNASSTYAVHSQGCARTDDVINWPGFDGRENAANNAAFVALFNPENALALIAALEQSQNDVHEANARNDVKCAQLCKQDEEIAMLKQCIAELESSPLAVKLPEEVIDQVCLTAAEIHNRGNGVNDDKAQFIIDRVRNYLENGGQVEGE